MENIDDLAETNRGSKACGKSFLQWSPQFSLETNLKQITWKKEKILQPAFSPFFLMFSSLSVTIFSLSVI